jgi:hypothetical protein
LHLFFARRNLPLFGANRAAANVSKPQKHKRKLSKMNEKKTLYHSELVRAGQCVIDINGDVRASKFKGKNGEDKFYVSIMFGGRERDFSLENDQCATSLKDRKGQRLTVTAHESREAAYITVEHADWSSGAAGPTAQSAPAPAAAPAPRPSAAVAAHAHHPAPTTAPARAAGPTLKSFLLQLANAEMQCQILAAKITEELESKRGIVLTPEQVGSMVGRWFIQITRDGRHLDLKSELMDITLPRDPAEERSDA